MLPMGNNVSELSINRNGKQKSLCKQMGSHSARMLDVGGGGAIIVPAIILPMSTVKKKKKKVFSCHKNRITDYEMIDIKKSRGQA